MGLGIVYRDRGPPCRGVWPGVVGPWNGYLLPHPIGFPNSQFPFRLFFFVAAGDPAGPIQTLDWVGTSMGGLIGLGVLGTPGLPLPVPVRRLVLNDVGPVIQWQALQRIGSYLGKFGVFANLQEAADALRVISSGFGPHTPQQWLELSRHMVKPVGDGVTLHYDPAIATPFGGATQESAAQGEAVLWQLYDAIQAKTLLVRGAQSDLLTRETAQVMGQRGPRASLVEFEGVGHAPTFVADDQVQAVTRFLMDA